MARTSALLWFCFWSAISAVDISLAARSRSNSRSRRSRVESPERVAQHASEASSDDDPSYAPSEGSDDGNNDRPKLAMNLRRRSSSAMPSGPMVPNDYDFSPSSYMMAMAPAQYAAAAPAQYYTYMPVQQNNHLHQHYPVPGVVASTGAKIQSALEKGLRIGILVLMGYFVTMSWSAIEKDMADRIAAERATLSGRINLCKANFDSNNCANPVELTKAQCQEWETCMAGSPLEGGTRVEVFAVALGSVFQKFLAAFTWETKFFLLFASILVLNVFKSSVAWLLSGGNGNGSSSTAPHHHHPEPIYHPQPLLLQPTYPIARPQYVTARRGSRSPPRDRLPAIDDVTGYHD